MNDPDRYAAMDEEQSWNMGPFYVRINTDTGNVVTDSAGAVLFHRKPGQQFFDEAKAANCMVRVATLTIVGPQVLAPSGIRK